MTQLNPSTEYESKAIALVMEMRDFLLEANSNLNADEVNARYRDIQTRFSEVIGKPLTQFEPFVKGEPARSDKVNRFISHLQKDINILEDQIELMRANSIFIHNNMRMQVQQAKNENASVSNKMKSLQLYTSSQNNEITIFGDYFKNDNFIDKEKVDPELRALLETERRFTLPKNTISATNPLAAAKIKILSTSNGFPGRLVEVEEITNRTPTNPVTGGKIFRFLAEDDERSDLFSITDNSPGTWFEYEKNLVSEDDRVKAFNYNFKYQNTNDNIFKELKEVVYPVAFGEYIDWANGPDGDVLRLDIEFDLKSVQKINEIVYSPFGLEDNKNNPVMVSHVEVSVDNNTWETLQPTNVVITPDVNLAAARISQEVVAGSATWNLRDDSVRYIRFHIQQKNPIDSQIGHLWYRKPRRIIRVLDPTSSTPSIIERVVGGERVEGRIPTTSNPTRFYDPSFSVVEDSESTIEQNPSLVKNVEIFNGKRWAIGIRDISARSVKYSESGSIISKPFKIGGVIDRVSLESGVYIPEEFPASELWVKYYISPNDGVNWYQISRVQDDYIGIPEILSFNDPIPAEFREGNVGHYSVSGVVNSVRVKIEIDRPSNKPHLTPVVSWYKLKIKRR